MRKSLLGMYHDLKESASTSDFPYLLGNTMYKKLLGRFNGFPSPWRQYTMLGDLADFKAHDRIILSEAPDLDEIEENGNYKEAKFSDAKYSIQAKTFGKTFSVGRTAIINDDLHGIMQMPQMFGRATVRTMVKRILGLLSGNANAYDGSAIFALRTATTRNYTANVSLANTAAGMAAISACMQRIRSQVEPSSGELMGLTPKYLLTGTTLAPVAQQLIKSAQILPVSTNGGGTYNVIGTLTPIEDPLIDIVLSSSWWAVLADPQDCPVIEVGFLNGKAEPDLLVSKAEMVSMAGGSEDPYGYEFDDIHYKVRHDWAAQLGYYQGICRGSS
ncbi:MAG: Mu-like prophage major head subunit gpT family protein [Candidatus Omnitrophica bacterium]|nr:Mu-like prophage major head subunit gpT family protein [Candidatus Omnitrophota bacterium]